MAARDPSRAEEAIETLKTETGKDDIHFLPLDLADLASVRKAAELYLRSVFLVV